MKLFWMGGWCPAWFRDFVRGYSDADWESARVKLAGPHRPGQVVELTGGELRAVVMSGYHV